MARDRKSTGYFGEEIACKVLEKKGYRLLSRNYTIRGGEIDLVMEKDNEIVFAEVKTRRNEHYGEAMESITPQKKKRILRAAEVYLCGTRKDDPDIRFFAVVVILDDDDRVKKVEIYEDIFI